MESIEPGKEIAERYVVRSRLGKGGMGAAYLCFDKLHQREVALKLPRAAHAQTKKDRDRFMREFAVLSQLRHKNIVEVFDCQELEDGVPFFTMEYLRGVKLANMIAARKRPVSSKEDSYYTLTLLEELAEALCYVHSFGILHHDLTTHNVMLVSANEETPHSMSRVKLFDFGIAIDKDMHTPEDAAIGTAAYQAPEQHRAEVAGLTLDFTSDVYAFAVIMYEVFTGERPFQGEEDIVKARHCAGNVPAIKTLHSRISENINETIQICMQKENELRFQSMNQVLYQLRNSIEDIQRPSFFERMKLLLRVGR